jgi:hypothetical protein
MTIESPTKLKKTSSLSSAPPNFALKRISCSPPMDCWRNAGDQSAARCDPLSHRRGREFRATVAPDAIRDALQEELMRQQGRSRAPSGSGR